MAVQVVWEKQQSTLTCCSVFLFSLVAKLIRKCGPREEEFLMDRGNGGWGGDAGKGKLLPLRPDAFPIFQRNRRRQNHAELETKFKQTPHEPPYCLVSFNSFFQGCRHKNAHIMPFFLGKLGPLVPPPSVCPAAKKFPPSN